VLTLDGLRYSRRDSAALRSAVDIAS